MTRVEEEVRETVDVTRNLEERIARRRAWHEYRNETDLSPLAEKWLRLDDIHREHHGFEGYNLTLAVLVFVAIALPAGYEDTEPPAVVNEEAADLINELARHGPVEVTSAFIEIVPDDVPDRDATEPETPHQ